MTNIFLFNTSNWQWTVIIKSLTFINQIKKTTKKIQVFCISTDWLKEAMSQKSVKVQSVDYFMTCFSSSNITRKQGNIDATGFLCLHHSVAFLNDTAWFIWDSSNIYLLYPCHYNPRFAYFLPTFWSSFMYCDLWPYVWLVYKSSF